MGDRDEIGEIGDRVRQTWVYCTKLFKNIAYVGSFKHFVYLYLCICVFVYSLFCECHILYLWAQCLIKKATVGSDDDDKCLGLIWPLNPFQSSGSLPSSPTIQIRLPKLSPTIYQSYIKVLLHYPKQHHKPLFLTSLETNEEWQGSSRSRRWEQEA